MRFSTKQEGSLIKVALESNEGVELFVSTKHYRNLDGAMKDIIAIVEFGRQREIEIIDRTILDGEEA